MSIITADDLSMTYRVPVRDAGLSAAVRSLFHREFRNVEAVKAVSFAVEPGELVGFIGPNGAGKTTTLKMLSGILHPTGGKATVTGHTPHLREYPFLRRIALIRGSRPLSVPGELTVLDALRFQQLIYELPADAFRRNLSELSDLLELGPLLDRQVRALSLGERMRAGLAASLVYRPSILFLDEPTLGLDVSAVAAMRRFIADYNRQTGATILLTSHYMADVATLCRRIILIDHGALVYDGDLASFAASLTSHKLVTVTADDAALIDWQRFGEVSEQTERRVQLRIERHAIPAVTARLLAEATVTDLSVEEPPLEAIMDQVYRRGVSA
jgi:ABC-2 type transport system ATP-binding protein